MELYKKRLLSMTMMILSIVIFDQWTKYIIVQNFYLGEVSSVIPGFFNLIHIRNSGAAFGFGAGSGDVIRITFFLIIPVAACFWLVWSIWKSVSDNFLMCIAYSLVLSGAVGNLIDRFRLKYVVDFFDFYYKSYHFAAFNIADSCITIAAFLIIYDYILQVKADRKKIIKG